jgi:hypothetical protein
MFVVCRGLHLHGLEGVARVIPPINVALLQHGSIDVGVSQHRAARDSLPL